jgi:hypothetical protein
VVLLRHWRDWRSQFVLGALVLGVAPSLLAVNGPHAMRSIGAVAFACIIAALGWRALIGWMGRWLPARGAQRASMVAVVALALMLNFWTYFVYMPLETRVWTSFYPIHTKVGTYLREMAQEEGAEALRHVYVPEGLTDNSVFQYLAYGLPVQTFDDDSLSMPADSDALFVFSIYTYEDEVQELHSYLNPQAEPVVRGPNLPGEPVPAFVVHRAEE